MIKSLILILILITCNSLFSQIFEISNKDYFSYMIFMGWLDIRNNYIDEMVMDDLSEGELAVLDWDNKPFFDSWISIKVDKELKDLRDYSYLALLGSSLILT